VSSTSRISLFLRERERNEREEQESVPLRYSSGSGKGLSMKNPSSETTTAPAFAGAQAHPGERGRGRERALSTWRAEPSRAGRPHSAASSVAVPRILFLISTFLLEKRVGLTSNPYGRRIKQMKNC